jgi:hypothetical protein
VPSHAAGNVREVEASKGHGFSRANKANKIRAALGMFFHQTLRNLALFRSLFRRSAEII